MTRPRIGVLVASGPAEGDLAAVESAVRGALAAGADVGLFLMDDGVGYASDARLKALIDAGAEVALCAMDAEARGVSCAEAAAAGVLIGSQYDHARLLRDSEHFLSFT